MNSICNDREDVSRALEWQLETLQALQEDQKCLEATFRTQVDMLACAKKAIEEEDVAIRQMCKEMVINAKSLDGDAAIEQLLHAQQTSLLWQRKQRGFVAKLGAVERDVEESRRKIAENRADLASMKCEMTALQPKFQRLWEIAAAAWQEEAIRDAK